MSGGKVIKLIVCLSQHAANQNRFSQLDQTEAGSPSYYEGRGSGGRFRQGNQQDRGQYGGRNSRFDRVVTGESHQKYLGFLLSVLRPSEPELYRQRVT